MDKASLKRLGLLLVALGLCFALSSYWATLPAQVDSALLRQIIWIGHYVIGGTKWLLLVWIIIRIIDWALDALVWPIFIERRLKVPVPSLLHDVVHLLVWLIALSFIVSFEFEKSISGFFAASGVIGLILGLALQHMIADFFGGISLNLERDFRIGDRIRLESGESGEVIEINWRTTVIKDNMENTISIPNSKISSMRIENYDKPQQRYWRTLTLHLDFDVPTERAIRLLKAAVVQAYASRDEDFEPYVYCRDITTYGIEYRVFFAVPSYPSNSVRSEVIRCIMQHLTLAGIRPVYPQHHIAMTELPRPQLDQPIDPEMLLRRIALFTVLNDEEVAALARCAIMHRVPAGQVIVKQGELGASMFALAEGVLYVSMETAESEDAVKVGQIAPGEFFGEMSLLTGEPRAATVSAKTDAVLYEITKDDMGPILENRPDIAKQLSQMVAQRRIQNEATLKNMTAEEQESAVQDFTSQLLHAMSRFFTAMLS